MKKHLALIIGFLIALLFQSPPGHGGTMEKPLLNNQKTVERLQEHVRVLTKTIGGMICLEMVGYTCHMPGCQSYPFPLMFFGYPQQGDFIGIVGNLSSWGLTRSLARAFAGNPNLPVVKLTVPFDGWLLPAVRLSDHASFWDEGFKAVMVTDSAFYRNPHYHLLSDRMEKLDFDFMCEPVQSLLVFFNSQAMF